MSMLRNLRAAAPALKTAPRGLATPVANVSLLQHVLPPKIPAALHLKTGQSFYGNNFGSTESKFGETVFSTSITSCKRFLPILTDGRHRLDDRPVLPRADSRLHLAHDW
jgi:hypothetical protein